MSQPVREEHHRPGRFFTETLARRLGGGFRSERLSREVVLTEVGHAATGALIDWDDVNDLLATRPVAAPQLRLFRDGEEVPVGAYARTADEGAPRRQTLRPEALYRELRGGTSLILDAVDTLHPPVARAAEDLTRFVHEPVQVNLYAVWGSRQGFETHWDDHDVFVVQVAGTKRWTIHGPGLAHPLKRELTTDNQCPEEVVWEGTLRAGQVLHVPRGWWHGVRGTGNVSLHLTFGFARRTGLDWLAWVAEELRDEACFRADLPRFAPPGQRAAHAGMLRTRLAQALERHDLEAFLEQRDAAAPRRYRFCLPHAVAADGLDLSETTRVSFTPVLPRLARRNGTVRLATDRKRFTFAGSMEPLLRTLASDPETTCGRLREASGLDRETFRVALELLVERHLVVVDPPTPDHGARDG